VGPCLGEGVTSNNCSAPKLGADGTANYPFTFGNPVQPRCTSVEILDGISCGVDGRHKSGHFTIKISESSRQEFDEINIFDLYVWVDLLSIAFHVYAIAMTFVSAYEDVPSAIVGATKSLLCCGKKVDLGSFGESKVVRKLEEPTLDQLHSTNYPRSAEYNRRWLDIALCYGILTVATAISVGITNFFTLSGLFLQVQLIGFLGFMIDDARYQLRITDSDSYNKNILYQYLGKVLDNLNGTIKEDEFGSVNYFQQQIRRMKPLSSGWTQPVRNIFFCIGLQIILWYFVTFTIVDAADNIIIQMPEDGVGADAFKDMASIFRWLTGIIGFYQLLIIIGDLVAEDRTASTVNPPGNFLLDQLDGDACFVILMFTTKIIVSWFAISIITEVYNFAGGRETRNEVISDSYLDKGIESDVVRALMTWLGLGVLLILTLFNWFLTPSSYMYPYVGYKMLLACGNSCECCKCCLPPRDDKEEDEDIQNPQADKLRGRSRLYF
jgi:hypothetical protein